MHAGGSCRSCPTKSQPIKLGGICPTCKRQDPARLTCPDCHGWGEPVLVDCPLKVVPAEIWELITAADMARRGQWPTLAGWLDQPVSLVQGVRLVWGLQSQWRAKLGIKESG